MLSNCFIFNEKYFQQINGTLLGSPLSVIICEIVVQYIEIFFDNAGYLIKFWCRYVEDVFVVAEYRDLPFNHAISIYSFIQFTIEYEKIPFLDILIHRGKGSTYKSSKPQFTELQHSLDSGRYLNFDSDSPKSHEIEVVIRYAQ